MKLNLNMTGNFLPNTRISSDVLKNIISQYKFYLTYLEENGILEYDSKNKSFKGNHSKGYRFTEIYKNSIFVKDTITDKKLLRKIFEYYNANEFSKRELANYQYLTKWFNDDFAINQEEAFNYIDNILEYEEDSFFKKALQKQQVQAILDKRYYFTVDNKGYRFHTVLTNLKSELRNYLTYGGEKLGSIDLSNSQPFLVTLLLNPNFYDANNPLLSIYNLPNFQEIIDNVTIPIFENIKSYVNGSQKLRNEIDTYTFWVKSGNFYENFADEIEANGIIIEGETAKQKRGNVKNIFFSVLFGNNHTTIEKRELRKPFIELFPTIYRILSLYKRKEYKMLSWLLQRIESEIFLRKNSKNIFTSLS